MIDYTLTKESIKDFIRSLPEVLHNMDKVRAQVVLVERNNKVKITINDEGSEVKGDLGLERIYVGDLYRLMSVGKYKNKFKRKPIIQILPYLENKYNGKLKQLSVEQSNSKNRNFPSKVDELMIAEIVGVWVVEAIIEKEIPNGHFIYFMKKSGLKGIEEVIPRIKVDFYYDAILDEIDAHGYAIKNVNLREGCMKDVIVVDDVDVTDRTLDWTDISSGVVKKLMEEYFRNESRL